MIRALWFVFIGWWLSGLVIALAYLAMATIIGIPLAFYLFNRIPQVLTLRRRTTTFTTESRDGTTYLVEGTVPQYPLLLRVLYFLVIGFWIGGIWLSVAWVLSVLILTLPLAIWMFNRTGGVMTLHRH